MTRTGAPLTTLVWLALSAITLIAWFLAPAHANGIAVASVWITVVVLALGFVKARLIIRYFMEVRTAPQWLRLFTDIWLVALWGGVLAIYLY